MILKLKNSMIWFWHCFLSGIAQENTELILVQFKKNRYGILIFYEYPSL